MKQSRLATLGAVGFVCAALLIVDFRADTGFASMFEKGFLPSARVKGIIFERASGKTVLSDPRSIKYLCETKRYAPLPESLNLIGGRTFDVVVRGTWGRKAVCVMFIGDDGAVIQMSSYRGLFDEPVFSYLRIGEDAPAALRGFLSSLP